MVRKVDVALRSLVVAGAISITTFGCVQSPPTHEIESSTLVYEVTPTSIKEHELTIMPTVPYTPVVSSISVPIATATPTSIDVPLPTSSKIGRPDVIFHSYYEQLVDKNMIGKYVHIRAIVYHETTIGDKEILLANAWKDNPDLPYSIVQLEYSDPSFISVGDEVAIVGRLEGTYEIAVVDAATRVPVITVMSVDIVDNHLQ